jgi:hypothetical protein
LLAYVFWHRPGATTQTEAYEERLLAFHRSLAHTPPVGMCASAAFRAAELPWLGPTSDQPGYEDWYLLEDYAALGVLGEAAVGRGHRTSHDRVAAHSGDGAGGLYALIEGEHSELLGGAATLRAAQLAIWVKRAAGSRDVALGELLGDGMDPRSASLWRRRFVLGPAPEYCLLANSPSAGVAPARLPEGWTAQTFTREALLDG